MRPDGVGSGSVDLPTRPLPVDVAEGPIDLVAVQADDELVNALGSGAAVTYGDRAPRSDPDLRRPRDERLVAMLAAWRAEIEAEPIPELVDLDTAVAAVVAGMKADEAGTRRRRADRLRHLAPLAAAAAIIVATISGVGLGSQDAMPGDTLWGIQKIVDPERAESVETKIAIESRLQIVRVALATGDTETAARELDAISTEITAVLSEDGQSQLLQEQEFLDREAGRDAARHARGPVHPADERSERPLDDGAGRAAAARRPRPPTRRSWWSRRTTRRCRSRSIRTRRTPSEALVPAPASESGSEGPTTPGSGSSEPEVTKEPTESAPESTEGGADETTAPAPSGDDQPASEGGASLPASDGAQGGVTSTDTTASGSAGTSIDATGTATAS